MKLVLFTTVSALSILLTATQVDRNSINTDDRTSKQQIDSNDPFLTAATCDETIRLTVTAAGNAINADGNARIRADARGNQDFRVEITVKVAKGTVFNVLVDGTQVGTMAAGARRARLVLTTDNGSLPASLDPVCGAGQVDITDAAGTTILTGTF